MKNVQFVHHLRRNIQERGRGSVRQGGGGWQSKVDREAGRPDEGTVSGLARTAEQEGQLCLLDGRKEGRHGNSPG